MAPLLHSVILIYIIDVVLGKNTIHNNILDAMQRTEHSSSDTCHVCSFLSTAHTVWAKIISLCISAH